jgi:hypothetical protein
MALLLQTIVATQGATARVGKRAQLVRTMSQGAVAALSATGDGALAMTINGVDKTAFVLYDSLTIRDVLNQPKTCTFTTVNGYQPPAAATLIISRGPNRFFAGSLTSVQPFYVGAMTATNVQWAVSAINFNFLLRRRRPFKVYAGVSATTVAQDLVASFSSTFTTVHVQASLPAVTIAFDGTRDLPACLSALCALIGGYWYVDEYRDVHLFLAESGSTPDPIDDHNTSALLDPPLTTAVDYSQIRTRDYVKGAGTTAPLGAAAGAKTLTVTNGALFGTTGGTVLSGAQRVTYTGISLGSVLGLNTVQWSAATSQFTTNDWTAIVWAPALGLFVAVSSGSGVLTVVTSPDGTTWTSQTAASSSAFQAIAWSPSLGLLVAVGTGGAVMTSPDGITWTTRTAASLDSWVGLCWSPDLSLFVAVSSGATTYGVMTSPDGVTWTGRTAANANTWCNVTWASSLSLFAAVANGGGVATSYVMTSPDGITWTTRTTPTLGYNIAWSPPLSLFVVTVGVSPYTSPDGVTWTTRTNAMNVASASWWGLVWADFMFVATCDQTVSNFATSLDGITWSVGVGPGAPIQWRAIAYSSTLPRLVAVGYTSGLVSKIMTTSNLTIVLTGIPASGVGAILSPIAVGDPVFLWVQRDNLAAQAVLAAIEDGGASDGIHEGEVVNAMLTTIAACNAAGDADLALFDAPVTTCTYATRDLKTRSGKPVSVNPSAPAVGPLTLTIQDVTITQVMLPAPGGPHFAVSASTVKFTLQDLLARILEGISVT